MIYNKETDVVSVSNNTYIHIKLNLFPCNKKGIDSIFAANSKEEAEAYVTTGVTSIPRHLLSCITPNLNANNLLLYLVLIYELLRSYFL